MEPHLLPPTPRSPMPIQPPGDSSTASASRKAWFTVASGALPPFQASRTSANRFFSSQSDVATPPWPS